VLGGRFSPYAFVAPFFVLFAAFGLYPLIYTGWVSLHRVELSSPEKSTWLGWSNYSNLLHNEFFWNALKNTFTLGVISTVPQLLLALGLAHLLSYKLRGRTFFRIAMLMPYATSVAATAIVFTQLFGRDFGLINGALGLFGVDHISWESGHWSSQIAISAMVTWRWTGYNALIYLAAMQAVPRELYESAAMDGASKWQQFRYVTVPSLRPTILFTVVVSTIGATQLFGEPLLFGGISGHLGGSDRQYQTLGLLMYDQGWFNGHLGRAAATAWTMFILIVILVLINARVVGGRLREPRAKAGAR
jgi:cellobiose transport system permease protein